MPTSLSSAPDAGSSDDASPSVAGPSTTATRGTVANRSSVMLSMSRISESGGS